MNINDIVKKFENRKRESIENKKSYSVLLPLIDIEGDWHVLFEVRSKSLKTQPNEISLPGGKVEKHETFKEAAIRETHEELNIDIDKIKVIGKLDYIVFPYDMTIYGYVGILENIEFNKINYNRLETDHIFTVPLSFFIENPPLKYNVEYKMKLQDDFPYYLIQDGKRYKWRKRKESIYFYEYNDYVIWGITATFIKNFIDVISI
ncbi:MutT/NUDIX hydrolase familiy protein [Gottschalkia purinilytica]|uniref:MutT/NUDIX hydrolase familiy protein n=1 Tax=Gottschalkia purinilytica TaxID=1503 RepID=A0A0L0W8Y6_GOTPU|nr:CoA pyrophosphatase [Gottschalkia purinilytica]KNF07770.1 MutT/NUDIX hydrolase familiy protein [Gottschalkia purinilytica]